MLRSIVKISLKYILNFLNFLVNIPSFASVLKKYPFYHKRKYPKSNLPLHSLISHYTLAGGATLASSICKSSLQIPTIATCKKDPHPHATNVLLPTLQGT